MAIDDLKTMDEGMGRTFETILAKQDPPG